MDTVLTLQRLLQSLGQMSRVCLGIATCGTSAVWAQMLVVHCVTTRWNQFKDRSDILVNCLRLTHTKQILTNHGMRWHHVKSGFPRQRASTKLSRPIATFSPQERRELGWIMCNSASMCKRVQVCVCARVCRCVERAAGPAGQQNRFAAATFICPMSFSTQVAAGILSTPFLAMCHSVFPSSLFSLGLVGHHQNLVDPADCRAAAHTCQTVCPGIRTKHLGCMKVHLLPKQYSCCQIRHVID